MNTFDSFYRFFALADDSVARPHNLNLPATAYPNLPAIVGDTLRWLVPKSDCGSVPVQHLSIGIRPKGATDAGTLCGRIRQQAGATYTEIRLRVNSAPVAGLYQQFALMVGSQNLMGTFRGQQTNLDAFTDALQEHFAGYPFAFVECDRMGYELRIRLYPNGRVSLHGETIRVGIGTVRERNQNSPSLIAIPKLGLSLPSEERYSISISPDIQAGNVFVLDGVSYTATGQENPADILDELGASSGQLIRAGGLYVTAYAQPGTQIVANTNRPSLQLIYDTTTGGTDKYTAVVSVNVQPGNVYQVAGSGTTTKTVMATISDNKASIEAQFNTVSGRFILPAGTVPVAAALAGSQTLPNTNSPTLTLTKTSSRPSRIADLYTIYIGSSVLEGNGYELRIGDQTVSATATDGDDALRIAKALGYDSNPFTVEVPPATNVTAIARRGPAYHEPGNVSAITLLSARTAARLPYVAEVVIPTLPTGDYQFVLRRGPTVVGISNYVHLKPNAKDTALVRFGAEKPASVFGSVYSEDGLMQQIRLPIYVDKPKLRQNETLYQTLENVTVRGRTFASPVSMLTTTVQDEAFHRNLFTALKHPVLYVDGKAYRCEGEYSQTDPIGRRRRRQATADLVSLSTLDYRPSLAGDLSTESGTYAVIDSVACMDVLWIAAKRLNFVQTISEGMTLPAADYDILIRAGAESQRVTIGQDGEQVASFLLIPNKLNRLGIVRFGPGRISLAATLVSAVATATTRSGYHEQNAVVSTTTPHTTARTGDFNPDFNTDFQQ